mmetsp:Transcript_17611/g.40602  ORF Transcript_17611/g.40602 Transcript_17611/m.40602 type:complete len:86 (-) Transcript_17611:396-653(-)
MFWSKLSGTKMRKQIPRTIQNPNHAGNFLVLSLVAINVLRCNQERRFPHSIKSISKVQRLEQGGFSNLWKLQQMPVISVSTDRTP